MKNTLLMLAAAAALLIASCNNGTTNDKANDNKTAIRDSVSQTGSLDSIVIPLTAANNMIQSYHQSISLKDSPNQHVSFLLNARALRQYLALNPNLSTLDVYLAKDQQGMMTVVYIGGTYDAQGTLVETPYMKQGDTTQYVLDFAQPCPTCDRDGIHSGPYKGQ